MENYVFSLFSVSKATLGVLARSHAKLDAHEGTNHMLGKSLGNTGTICIQVCLRPCYGTGNFIHSLFLIQIL